MLGDGKDRSEKRTAAGAGVVFLTFGMFLATCAAAATFGLPGALWAAAACCFGAWWLCVLVMDGLP